MARPFKESLDYFPLDVDFLEDKKVKLIKVEFGAKGILVLISLLALVYKSNGYFYKWDNDDCFLMSDGVGCGCSPEFIQEVLQGCVRRSIFDDGVFNMFNVLTSPGIQKRFITAVAERKNITIIKEYWLVDTSDKKVFTEGILKKLTINSINPPIKTVNPPINLIKPPNNPQSKVKESKSNKKHISSEFSSDDIQYKLALELRSYILKNNDKARVPDSNKLQSWASEIDKMLRLDKHTADEIRAMITYSQQDNFWCSCILSPSKLRDKYDTLYLQSKSKGKYQSNISHASNRGNFEQRDYEDNYFENFFNNTKGAK